MFAHLAKHSQNKLLAIQGFTVFEYGTISALGKGEAAIVLLLNSMHEKKVKYKLECLKIVQKVLIGSTNAISYYLSTHFNMFMLMPVF